MHTSTMVAKGKGDIVVSIESTPRGEWGLTASTLKLIACILMVVDHVGMTFFPGAVVWRAVGRLAFPLFAFFIAEGCRYTRSKGRRLGLLLAVGGGFALVYALYAGELYGNIFLTFSVSVCMIYLLQNVKRTILEKRDALRGVGALLLLAAALVGAAVLFRVVHFEYGYTGMLLPLLVSLPDFHGMSVSPRVSRLDKHGVRLSCMTVGLLLLSINGRMGQVQFFCLLSLIPLSLYNGQVGRRGWKYGFYLFYPLHLLVIEGLAMLIDHIG